MTAADLAAVTLQPGLHPNVPASTYHADACERPSLTKTVANLLTAASPRHAWTAHPRLNPNYQPATEDKFDLGVAVHSLLLEGVQAVCVVDAADWRTKAAQEERDLARAHGLIPMLAKNWDQVQEMVGAVREQLAAFDVDPVPLTGGQAEATIVWDEDGVLCRARLDWLHDGWWCVDDLKTTSRSANPERWARGPLFDTGCDLQAAMYLRGLRAVGATAKWRWVVAETNPPYAISVIEPDAAILAIGEAKFERALNIWRDCLATGIWPAYPPVVHRAELPPWIEAQWLEREAKEAA